MSVSHSIKLFNSPYSLVSLNSFGSFNFVSPATGFALGSRLGSALAPTALLCALFEVLSSIISFSRDASGASDLALVSKARCLCQKYPTLSKNHVYLYVVK